MSSEVDSQQLLSREELLRQWQEQKRAKQKKERVVASPKKVKVRVRRSHPTPGKDAALRLYEQGTVASRLKSKNPKQDLLILQNDETEPERQPELRRRKSEPNRSHDRRLSDNHRNSSTHKTTDNDNDDDSVNILIIDHVQIQLSPLSCSCRSSAVGSPSPHNPRRPRHYDSFEPKQLNERDHKESLTGNSILSDTSVLLLEERKACDNSQECANITQRSRSQLSMLLPSGDDHDDLLLEDWSQWSSPTGILLPRSPSQRQRGFSFGSDQGNQSKQHSWVVQSNISNKNELGGHAGIMLSQSPSHHERGLQCGNPSDQEPQLENGTSNPHRDSNTVDLSSYDSLDSRVPFSHLQPCDDSSDKENQTKLRLSSPQQSKYNGQVQRGGIKDSSIETDDDSFDWRKNQSPDTPLQRGPYASHTRRPTSMTDSPQTIPDDTNQELDGNTNKSVGGIANPNISDDDIEEDSFDWRQNLSPDTPPGRRSSVSVSRRRKESLLMLPRSPLDRFRHLGSPQSNRSSSSLDSNLRPASDEVGVVNSNNFVDDKGPGSSSASFSDNDGDDNLHHLLVADTFVQVDGRSILQPLREEIILPVDTSKEEKANSCSTCTVRDALIDQLRYQMEELQWRAEIAEAEKQKYQNQIYAMRKKYETRVTPFRDIFDEMSKLKKMNQILSKENQETKATLQFQVANLQKQMTEALTTVMHKNATLQAQLEEAECQIEEFRLEITPSLTGEQSV